MGVLFICDTKEYSCSYGSWSIVRMGLLRACLRYLALNGPEGLSSKEIDDINNLSTADLGDVDKFVTYVDKHGHDLVNLFIRFDIGGIWAIMNKQDDIGYYSPGNALDILIMIKNVTEHLDDENVKERIHSISKVLIHSGKTWKPIQII